MALVVAWGFMGFNSHWKGQNTERKLHVVLRQSDAALVWQADTVGLHGEIADIGGKLGFWGSPPGGIQGQIPCQGVWGSWSKVFRYISSIFCISWEVLWKYSI